ncbi:MAG: ABC transporter permease, partial [Sciscionella sp.]
LSVPSVEVAQSLGLVWLFPVSFISTAFVSAENMPGALRAFAEWNPFTSVINACRNLFRNPSPPNLPELHGWPAQHATLYSFICCVGILVVFVPLAVARYRRVSSR